LKKVLDSLLRGLAAGLVLYGRYTSGIYWDGPDDWYYLFYGDRQISGQVR